MTAKPVINTSRLLNLLVVYNTYIEWTVNSCRVAYGWFEIFKIVYLRAPEISLYVWQMKP